MKTHGERIIALLHQLDQIRTTTVASSTGMEDIQRRTHHAVGSILSDPLPASDHENTSQQEPPELTLEELIEQAERDSEKEAKNSRKWQKHHPEKQMETVFSRFWENVTTQYELLKDNQELQQSLQAACKRLDRLRDPAKLDNVLQECSNILRQHYLRSAIGAQLVTILYYDHQLSEERKQELLALFPEPDENDLSMHAVEIAERKKARLPGEKKRRRS